MIDRRQATYVSPDVKHKLATPVQRLIGSFHRIKTLSSSQEIDRLCESGISVLITMAGDAEIQEQLDAIRERMIDPTN